MTKNELLITNYKLLLIEDYFFLNPWGLTFMNFRYFLYILKINLKNKFLNFILIV